MTFEEYYKRMDFNNKILCIFIGADVVIMIIGWIVDAMVNKATNPNPIFSMIMMAIMIIHGFGTIVLDKELEKEYEENKKD